MGRCSFRRDHYRETLQAARDQGYSCAGLSEYLSSVGQKAPDDNRKILVLRHDMDGPLEPELEMSRVEKSLGVHSTFFVRLHAVFYNALSLPAIRVIQEIAANGSEIGLHYEPAFTDLCELSHAQGLERDRKILEGIIGRPVTTFAPHEPQRYGTQTFPAEDLQKSGFSFQAYDERLISGCKYLSDSGSRWREGCFCGWIGKAPRLCVLTHGFWWHENSSLENY